MFYQDLSSIVDNLEKELSKIPTSLFGRGAKLFGIASKMATLEISSRLKTWEDDKEKLKSKLLLAQDVVNTLSQLKGASMKLGQLISLDMDDYFPPEVIKILEQLHNQTTFISYEKIEAILKLELGDKFHHFRDISKSPIAAASIGQVHKAKLDGKEVVIKIQYPGVAESIPSDIRFLEIILKQLSFLQRKDTDLAPFFNEIKSVLINEADYKNELKMHTLYREKFLKSAYLVPDVYPDYSTSQILTQDFIQGETFVKWMESNPPSSIRHEFADLLMKLYLEEVFVHGLVQTDPNPGNFLITPNNKIALLDFGAVKEYDNTFIEGYRSVLKASFHKQNDKLLEESIKLKFIDPRESQEVIDIYFKMMEFLAGQFRQDHAFDFTDKSFLNKSRDLSWEMARKCKYSPPPKDLLFLHRKLAGVFIFIKKLDVKITLKDYWHYIE